MRKTDFTISPLLLIIIFNLASAIDSDCSASENVRWNKNKGRCVQCRNCRPGHFRNLTEQYTGRKGDHGDEQCLRCRPCPVFTYSATGNGECIRCRMNCADLNRELNELCSNVHDAKCGSCLSGFEDTFQNTKFMCAPSKSYDTGTEDFMISNRPPKPENHSLKHNEIISTPNSSPGNILSLLGNSTQLQTAVQRPSADYTDIIVITGAVMLALLAAILLAWICVIPALRRRRQAKLKLDLDSYQTASMLSDLSKYNDIEMDVFPHDDGNGRKRYKQVPHNDPEYVRAELDDRHPPRLRGELSHPGSVNGQQELVPLRLPGFGMVHVYCERNKDICTCKTEEGCRCQSDFCHTTQIHIKHSDVFILLTAKNICHNPKDLFRYLGLECSVIYQENDNRDRDPERISEKELVLKLLNRWVEIQSDNATLQLLSRALCRAKFHCINHKLYELYCQTLHTDTRF